MRPWVEARVGTRQHFGHELAASPCDVFVASLAVDERRRRRRRKRKNRIIYRRRRRKKKRRKKRIMLFIIIYYYYVMMCNNINYLYNDAILLLRMGGVGGRKAINARRSTDMCTLPAYSVPIGAIYKRSTSIDRLLPFARQTMAGRGSWWN